MMKPATVVNLLIAAIFAAVLSLSGHSARAEDALKQPWMPVPAKAAGGQCDADPAWMRMWHMKVLKHKRDETMHEGIRTPQYSLKRCIGCHAVKDETGRPVTVKDSRHFCRTCHDYAAVHVDCFDCHASRPGEGDRQAGLSGVEGSAGARDARNPADFADAGEAAMQKHFGGEGQ
jgi:hypothetical protein